MTITPSTLYIPIIPNRSSDWFRQAERDLAQASDSQREGRHEWACFAAHQATEKAIKALHLHHGQEAWGNVCANLLKELPNEAQIAEGVIEKSHVLDAYYIAPRYPNGHPEGAPFEHYSQLQSNEAISYASEIIEIVRPQMA